MESQRLVGSKRFNFAGSAAVHAMGGFAALATGIGAKVGKYNSDGTINSIEGHNLPLAAVGAFILWFGWFGLIGSSLGGNWELIGAVVVNTLASAAGVSLHGLHSFRLW